MEGKVCENCFEIRSVEVSLVATSIVSFKPTTALTLAKSSSMVARYFDGVFMTMPQQRFQYIAPKIHRAVTRLLPSGTIFLPT